MSELFDEPESYQHDALPESIRYLFLPPLTGVVAGGLIALLLLLHNAHLLLAAGIGATCIGLGFLASWLWRAHHRQTLRSLERLRADLRSYTRQYDPERRLARADSVLGNRLTTSINDLLATMHREQRKHAQTSESLQAGIEHRTEELSKVNDELREQNHVISSLAALADYMRGNLTIDTFSKDVLTFLIDHFDALSGSFYLADLTSCSLERTASHALVPDRKNTRHFKFGEGLVGQTALERFPKILNDLPSETLRLRTSVLDSKKVNLMLVPIYHESSINAVIELASIHPFGDLESAFMDRAAPLIGISLNSHLNRTELCSLLEKHQHQARAMQEQQERLQQTNEEVAARNLELENAQQVIEEKARELAQTNQYKTDFLANMSHELRTPLNSLLILSQSLRENRAGNLLPEQLEFVTTIHNAGQDLLNLINDVLDLSRVEAGKLQVDFAVMDPAELLSPLDRTFRKLAESKCLNYTLEVDASTPRNLLTDGFRLQQILRNFISNAIKFTDLGNVAISIRPEGEGVLFEVKDTGIGIAEDSKKMIFDAFQQADGTTARRYGGTGLGLAICQHLSELLHGRIYCDSVEGEGTTFSLWLPTVPSQLGTAPQLGPLPLVATPIDDLAFSGQVVLIVDDDMRSGYAVSEQIEAHNLQSEVARNGHAAMELLEAGAQVDLVLLDLHMPVMDGHETLRHLRANPATNKVPVIALASGHDNPSAELEAGFDGILTKPLDPRTLLELLHRHLEQPASSSSLQEAS